MPRANDPLACALYLLARTSVPWGTIEAILQRSLSDVAPEMPEDDPLVQWATQQADLLRNA